MQNHNTMTEKEIGAQSFPTIPTPEAPQEPKARTEGELIAAYRQVVALGGSGMRWIVKLESDAEFDLMVNAQLLGLLKD